MKLGDVVTKGKQGGSEGGVARRLEELVKRVEELAGRIAKIEVAHERVEEELRCAFLDEIAKALIAAGSAKANICKHRQVEADEGCRAYCSALLAIDLKQRKAEPVSLSPFVCALCPFFEEEPRPRRVGVAFALRLKG